MTATKTFEYTDSPDCKHEDFVLKVPAEIRSKTDLLAVLASAGRFPDYFGGNWDALEDCLRDLSWISNRKVVIVHSDLPLWETPAECSIYLEVLQTVLAAWTESVKPYVMEPPPRCPYVDHELRVVFPLETKAAIARLVGRF